MQEKEGEDTGPVGRAVARDGNFKCNNMGGQVRLPVFGVGEDC